jgi:hypothetical protein
MTRCLACDFDPDDIDSEPITSTDVSELVMAAAPYRTNADLIVACHRLGYINDEDFTFDATYGNGGWWKKWEPTQLCYWTEGNNPEPFDFTHMPEFWTDTFDAVTFDPPYVSPGGRSTTTIPAMHRLYGMSNTPPSPLALHEKVIIPGFKECVRVTKPGGVILVKCMDYISSGKFWPGQFHLAFEATALVDIIDLLYMVRSSSPQSQTTQVHARRNVSALFVFRKPK